MRRRERQGVGAPGALLESEDSRRGIGSRPRTGGPGVSGLIPGRSAFRVGRRGLSEEDPTGGDPDRGGRLRVGAEDREGGAQAVERRLQRGMLLVGVGLLLPETADLLSCLSKLSLQLLVAANQLGELARGDRDRFLVGVRGEEDLRVPR